MMTSRRRRVTWYDFGLSSNREVRSRRTMFTFSLTLVRHGETQYNRDKLLQGQGVDTPLSETGLEQGDAVGRYLGDITFNYVFASNLQRAVQGFGVAEGRPKDDLKNMANAAGQSCRDYTPPGGETLDQVKLRFKKFLKVLFEQMLDEPGCPEPDASAVASDAVEVEANGTGAAVASATDGLLGAASHTLVVSHGAYIRVAVKHLVEDLKSSLPAGVKTSQLFAPSPNTGVARFIFTLSRSESGPVLSACRCVFTNRKDHLENLTAAE
ncbi:Fructose-2,6-bisphosphatase TIGAR B [Liparis tanakae]|uniref:fructose-2,6-bisphosphate 2-phosphatase n=1 Tax=Liparis tanakae TaxID=230148 RepID=A0A4Z2HD27_9TELE|nr:Fructose-2,6-bisphosphatase TIGAR B [Liparis tanakae]